MKTDLSDFDILTWLEGCAAGSHLRQGIWQRAVDEFYPKLSPTERMFLFTYAKRDITGNYIPRKDYTPVGSEDYFNFLARYNPANQFKVSLEGMVDGKRSKETVNAYFFNGNYHIKFNQFCALEFVKDVQPIGEYERCNTPCIWHEECARYARYANINFNQYLQSRCDWFINKKTPYGADLKHFER